MAIAMRCGHGDPVDVEKGLVPLVEPSIVEASIAGLGWQTDDESQQLVIFADAERDFGQGQ